MTSFFWVAHRLAAQRLAALSWAQRTSGVCAVGYTT